MKILKYLFIGLILLAIGLFIFIKVISEQKPIGEPGTDANRLAHKVEKALGKQAFDTLNYLSFEFFRGGHKYLWDKKNEKAIIEWGDNKVLMDLKSLASKCYIKGELQEEESHQKLKDKAWSLWCNDSFWMIAPFKLFDPGTKRKIIELEEGGQGLMIEYASGGVTPGDSYLWMLDENHVPTGWKMWTRILPVQGMYTSWEGWQDYNGIKLSTKHSLAGTMVEMKNVKVGQSYKDLGYTSDPFTEN